MRLISDSDFNELCESINKLVNRTMAVVACNRAYSLLNQHTQKYQEIELRRPQCVIGFYDENFHRLGLMSDIEQYESDLDNGEFSDLITTSEAAALIGCSPHTLKASRKTKNLFKRTTPDYIKTGHKTVRYKKSLLEVWMKENNLVSLSQI